jgi:hypothetical protein
MTNLILSGGGIGRYNAFVLQVLEKKRTYRTSKPWLLVDRFLMKKKQKKSRPAALIPSNLKALKPIARLSALSKASPYKFLLLQITVLCFSLFQQHSFRAIKLL